MTQVDWAQHVACLREIFSGDVWLLDSFGRSVESPSFLFVACAIDFPLQTRVELPFPENIRETHPITSRVELDGEDYGWNPNIIWLRGRIGKLFGFHSPFSQGNDFPFQMGFVGIEKEKPPFEIHSFAMLGGTIDDYGGFMLDFDMRFAPAVSDAISESILSEFCSLLIADNDVVEYSDYLFDGYGDVDRVSLTRNGAVTERLSETDPDDPDDHARFGYFPDRECLDCRGIGEEYIRYPIRQVCETCRGSGRVTW